MLSFNEKSILSCISNVTGKKETEKAAQSLQNQLTSDHQTAPDNNWSMAKSLESNVLRET